MTTLRFETLIERYHDELYGYLWRLLDGAGQADATVDAQDLTQEVFLRAYKAFERLRPDSNYRAWLYKIATHCAYTALKRSQRQTGNNVPLLDDVHGDGITDADQLPDQAVAFNETLASARQAIAALPTKQRAALVLRHVQGLDYAEIAQALGCSEDSARANVYQALRRLRRELGEGEPGRGRVRGDREGR
jgi:RNA polymerase sigma-70 factor (ECF subfamily)